MGGPMSATGSSLTRTTARGEGVRAAPRTSRRIPGSGLRTRTVPEVTQRSPPSRARRGAASRPGRSTGCARPGLIDQLAALMSGSVTRSPRDPGAR